MIKLDYSLETPEERNELVKQILADNPEPGEKYLEILADYLVFCMEKQEKKERKIITENRSVTINNHETSFEGLASQLENGEDGIYNLIVNNKQAIFKPKVKITKQDLNDIPLLAQLYETIQIWEARLKCVEGKDAFIIKKALIEMRKDQYLIKNAYRVPTVPSKLTHTTYTVPLEDLTCTFDENGFPIPEGISLMNPKVCSMILCNYSKLKEDSWDKFYDDCWYLIYAFEEVCDRALKNHPVYARLVELKIDGLSNIEIQETIQLEFGIKHTVEYISSLWRNKIPKLIAAAAEDEYLQWYYLNVEHGTYKKCSRCGQIKLAHNKYFSKNKTSRDGYYSICKECRKVKKQ